MQLKQNHLEERMDLVSTQKETYNFMEFENKLRKEIDGFFKHEWKRLDPVYDKIERFRREIDSFADEFDTWNTKLKQAQMEQIKRDEYIRADIHEELKVLRRETMKYDEKINNLLRVKDDSSVQIRAVDIRVQNYRE